MNVEINPTIAVLVLVAILLVFVAALLVPRRPRVAHVPLTEVKLDGIRERLDELEKKQAQNDHDVRGIRMIIQAMPTEKTAQELRLQVSEVTGKVDGMHETLITNGHSLRRIEDYLINVAIETVSGKNTKAPAP